jgi:hypothetical protein
MKAIAGYVILCGILLLGLPLKAEAFYLDPTTGSMILQIVMGGALAVLAATKLYWSRIRSLFRKERKDKPEVF